MGRAPYPDRFDMSPHILWRYSANHTHLYHGALLRRLDAPCPAPSSGDEMLVEFSDGVSATGQLRGVDGDLVVLQMPTYRTGRGTQVAAKTWRLGPAEEPGAMRVRKRLPAT